MIGGKKFQNKILEQITEEKWSCSFNNNLNLYLYYVIQLLVRHRHHCLLKDMSFHE